MIINPFKEKSININLAINPKNITETIIDIEINGLSKLMALSIIGQVISRLSEDIKNQSIREVVPHEKSEA
jgi:hypothetical protein